MKLLLSQQSCFVGVTLCFSVTGDRGVGNTLLVLLLVIRKKGCGSRTKAGMQSYMFELLSGPSVF